MSGAVAAATVTSANNYLVADLGLDTTYEASEVLNPVSFTLTFKTDRTWEITVGSGDSLVGSPTSGTWLTAGGTAADHELEITVGAGTPTVVNDASSWIAMTANRAIQISIGGGSSGSRGITAKLRRIGGGLQVSDTSDITVNGGP